MLQPYPLVLRARAQSNPSRPKATRSNSSPSSTDPPDLPTSNSGAHPTPSLTITPIQESSDKKPFKKLQRPRRGSLFSSSSTSSVQLVPSPVPTAASSPQLPAQTLPSPSIPPPSRPPRNPARLPSSDIRPSSSSGPRDHKPAWDSASPGPSASGSPLFNKFVRRHKSVSAHARPSSSPGVVSTVSGSLLTKAGRMERRDRDKEREREKERAEGEQGSGAIQRDKGKEKEKDGLRERNSKALAHALNASAFASASLPFQSDLISSRAHARPHSQVVAPQNPHTSSVSYDSHSSNSISTSNSNSTQSDHSPQHKPQTKGKSKEKRSRPNFSTLDRTILEELKASLTARESQFAYKGPRGGLGRIGEKGFRHHPFKKEEVPYPRSYERTVVDLSVLLPTLCAHLLKPFWVQRCMGDGVVSTVM
jgi:hypothetical protein